MTDLDSRVDALRKAGRFAEAANLCLQEGEPERASELFAAVWDWPRAIQTAEDAGLFALAYRHALAAEDRGALGRLLAILPDHPEQAIAAATAAELKGRVMDAARLREAAGEVAEAAELFVQAGELFDAARCYESVGDYRTAGMLYERRIREDPTDGEAALRLGRILAHFGRYDHAVRALQVAEQDSERRDDALELMVACFDALKMNEAAAACLDRLRARDRSLPVRVPDYLEQVFGDPRGLAGLSKGEEASQLLAGRYRILHSLGAGATGRVLLAHDGFYDREVAVKVLSIGSGAQGRDAYARFAREARVAAGLEHPNVIHVFEFNPDGPFLVMEHMAGGTLADRLDEGMLPLATVEHVALSTLRGLEAVHRRGVIHRDLKPANIFFGDTGDVKIGDFGVAHLQDLGATLTGALLGTLAYMAPEQITGSQRPRAATDLYAFGCILYLLLTGELPIPGPDFVTQHLERVPAPVSQVRPSLGDRFDAVAHKLLSKELEKRPQSVEEVRIALSALDWTDPEENVLDRLVEMEQGSAPSVPPRPSSIPATPDRYSVVEIRDSGGFVARDELLGRMVRIEACDEERARWLMQLGQADHPHLQAIFDIDQAMDRCVLEEPQGVPMTRATMSNEERAKVRAEVGTALASLHSAGVVHGEVRMSSVRVGAGRATLLLPSKPSAGTKANDLEALEHL
ncbi:MAG: protein kinase [Myxococcota bacterium]